MKGGHAHGRGGYRFTDFPWLYNRHPEELRATILGAIREQDGHMENAAAYLGIAKRVMYGYIYKLDADDARAGVHPGFQEQVRELRDALKLARQGRRVPRGLDTSVIGSLMRTDREKAAKLLTWTYEDAYEFVPLAARMLGISARRFHTYAQDLDILPESRSRPKRRDGESAASFAARSAAWKEEVGARPESDVPEER
jgi:hypothetical protein